MTITDNRLGNGVLNGNGYLFATGLLSEPEPSKPAISELRSKSERDILEDRKKSGSLKFPTFSKPVGSNGKSENCAAVRSGKKKKTITSAKRTASHSDPVKSLPTRRKTGSPGSGTANERDYAQSHTHRPPEDPCDSTHSNSSTFQRLHNEHFERLSRQEDRYQEIVMKRLGEEEDFLKECTFVPNASRRTSQQQQVVTGNKTWERLYSTETISTKHFHKSKEEPLPGPGSYDYVTGVPIPSLNQARSSERSSQASSTHSVNGKVSASHGSTPSSVTSNEGRERRGVSHRGYQNTWSKLASGIPTGKTAEKLTMNHDTSRLASMGSSSLRSPRKRGVSPRVTKPRVSPRGSQSAPTNTPTPSEEPAKAAKGGTASEVVVSSPSPVLPQQKHSKPRVTIDCSSPLVHSTSNKSWDKESGLGSLSVSSHADSGSELRVDSCAPVAGKCIDCGQAIPSELPYCPATGNKHNGSDTRIVRLEAPVALASNINLRKESVASASQSCDDTDLPTAIDRGSVPDTDDASTVRQSYSLALRSVKSSGIGKSTRELLRNANVADDELSLA
eukprot:TRINITY_DN25082_c0_g1_i1.p1 TRINITY_DN25082_c0_g1~~TRINITY_DN25082_c0_g1_i1.p1  ORF type:complete len:561 (+),score=107.23 TRINITY_DN25082_c0_g1_i1:83-1765(+)